MSKKAAAEFLVTIGNRVYKWIRGKDDPNKLRDVLEKGGKINTKPTPKQLAGAKPFSSIAGAGSRAAPSRAQQAERAAQASRSVRPAAAPKPKQASTAQSQALRTIRSAERTAKPKSTAVVPRGRTAPAAPPRPPRPPRSSVPSGGRSGMTRGSTARLTPAQRLAILGKAGAAATQVMPKSEMPKAKAAPKMAMPKPKPPVQGPPRPPKKVSPGPVGPVKRGGAQKNITKGPNTGFGIKGNQFVGGPEERAIMMKYYGGTGSAAAKAAMEGKQGILKSKGMDALKKELAEARKKRLSRETKRNKGGKIKEVPIITIGKGKHKGKVVGTGKKTVSKSEGGKITPAKYKGFSKLPEKVQEKMSPTLAKKYKKGGKISKPKSEVVARQQRGWGAARKPKK